MSGLMKIFLDRLTSTGNPNEFKYHVTDYSSMNLTKNYAVNPLLRLSAATTSKPRPQRTSSNILKHMQNSWMLKMWVF